MYDCFTAKAQRAQRIAGNYNILLCVSLQTAAIPMPDTVFLKTVRAYFFLTGPPALYACIPEKVLACMIQEALVVLDHLLRMSEMAARMRTTMINSIVICRNRYPYLV